MEDEENSADSVRVVTPVDDVRPAGLCITCLEIKPISRFQHFVPGQSEAVNRISGRGFAKSRWQERKVCTDCRPGLRALPPPEKMTPRQLERAAKLEAIDPRLLLLNDGAMMDRAVERLNKQRAQSMTAYHERATWQPPWNHALSVLATEIEHTRGLVAYAIKAPPAEGAHELRAFTERLLEVQLQLRDVLRLRCRTSSFDHEALRVYRMFKQRVQQRARGAEGRFMGRPRTDMEYDRSKVMVPESVWADFIPPAQLRELDALLTAIPPTTRSRRLRHTPLILRHDAHCLENFKPVTAGHIPQEK